jgi:hypothetical protein
MVRIRRFGVVRTSTIVALWTLVAGLLVLIPFAIVVLAVGDLTTTDQFGNEVSFAAGASIIVFLVAIAVYAGFLWLFTAIAILIYNLVAGWVGGVEMELVNVQPQYPQYAQYPPQQPPPAQYPSQQPQPPGGWNPPASPPTG